MRVSPFKIGLALLVIGMVWTSLIFVETQKIHDTVLLKQSGSFEVSMELGGEGIGYFKFYIPEFSGEEIFVQILDARDNIIQEQRVQTKMSVGYFDFNEGGIHTLRVTNISTNIVDLRIELGDTNSKEMTVPGVMILVGAVIMMIASYVKISDYSIEQPEEKIS